MLTAKQAPHRPDTAPAHGLHAEMAVFSDTQTAEVQKGRLIMENCMKRYLRIGRLTLIVFVALIAAVLNAAVISAKEQPIAPPDEPGPFNVGVTTFLATMSG